MFLLDTNVLILGLMGKMPDADFLKKTITSGKLALSVITIAEFMTKASATEQKILEKLLAIFSPLVIDESVASIAGTYRKHHYRKSRTSLLDCFIAAQAKINHCTLVTHNLKDFPMKDIKIIQP